MVEVETLSPFQSELIRSVLGPHTNVLGVRSMQELRPCPIRVDVRCGDQIRTVVLRISRNAGGVERETLVLPILKEIGLPVPEILSNTVPDPSSPDLNSMMVMEFLPGETLQACALSDVSLAAQLLSEAIQRLHSVSDPRLADLIPRRSLLEDLDQAAVGPWMESSEIQDRVRRLRRVVEGIDIPLVFSNGDYQPANFLSDGESLTGMLDFEKAAFVDPLSVLARFPVYDLRPLSRSGFVESHLVRAGFTMRDFAARVAVFCLRTLQLKAPKTGGTEQQVALRRHVLELLSQAIDNVAD